MTFDMDFLYLLLLAGLCVMIGVLSTLLVARGSGLWIRFGKWSTSATQNFLFTRCYKFGAFGIYPFVRVGFRYWARTPDYRNFVAQEVRALLTHQAQDGQWNHSPYQLGIYNGIEVTLALLERRDPNFYEPPDGWLCETQCAVCGERDIHTGRCSMSSDDIRAKCVQFERHVKHLHSIERKD